MTVSHIFLIKMAVTMALFFIPLVLSVIGTNAAGGEFSVLHSPESLKFSESSKTLESLLKEIFSAALGLSVEENSEWKGMYIKDPFNTPEAAVEVYVDGVSSLSDFAGKFKTYKLTADEYEPDTFGAMDHRIKQRYSNGNNKIANINLFDSNQLNSDDFKKVFGKVITPPKVNKQNVLHLKSSVEEDYHFLNELASLKAIIELVETGTISPDNLIDFYSFRFRTLHALSDYHGPNSLQTKEAKKLLSDALQDLSKAFVKAYDGSVLVSVVTTDVAHTRLLNLNENLMRYRRDVSTPEPLAAPRATTTKDDGYSADYPAIFNIILWFAVVISFSLIAIVYALIDMDPGRDSIIYRMTSTRMKKDN